jgi:hypothetical protein
VESLGGRHVDSIGQRGDDKTRAIAEVLVAVPEGSISDSQLEVLLFIDEVDLELGLPLELISTCDLLLVEDVNDITGVSIHGNHAADLLTHGRSQITLDHSNQVAE